MLAVVKERPEPGIAVRECPEPTPGPGEVLVAVEGTGICGSDLHAYEWVPEYAWLTPHLPAILGHEIAGKVVDANGTDVPVGSTVAVRPGITCGRCEACQRNLSHRCENRVRLGYERAGGLAALVAAPAANVYPVPDHAAHVTPLVEPLTVSVHTVKRAAPRPGAATAVVGVGAIGLLTVEVLRAYGAGSVLLVGTEDDERGGGLAVGEALGASAVVAGSDEHGRRAGTCETVIVAAGAPAAVRGAIELADRGGTVAVLGLGIGKVEIDIDSAVRRELGLLGSFASVPADWLDAVELVGAGRVTGEGIVSHDVPLEDGVEAFELLASRKARKVVIHPTEGHR